MKSVKESFSICITKLNRNKIKTDHNFQNECHDFNLHVMTICAISNHSICTFLWIAKLKKSFFFLFSCFFINLSSMKMNSMRHKQNSSLKFKIQIIEKMRFNLIIWFDFVWFCLILVGFIFIFISVLLSFRYFFFLWFSRFYHITIYL